MVTLFLRRTSLIRGALPTVWINGISVLSAMKRPDLLLIPQLENLFNMDAPISLVFVTPLHT